MDDSPANQISLHVPRMYRVALRLLGDAERAEDTVQEACVKALAGLHSFDGRAGLSTWLYRITVNCAHDTLRAAARREAERNNHQSAPVGRQVLLSPVQSAESHELFELAWRLLDKLDDDCRSAFALTQLDGYSYDEAAEIEGQPRGTIASRVNRAKRILLDQMNAHIDGRAKS